MVTLKRIPENPILVPDTKNEWEHDGSFNGCVAYADGVYHMVYRALSSEQEIEGVRMRVSTVGYANSTDGIHFENRRLLFGPKEEWEIYGCEDPRITYLDGKFYIFYTALSVFPFTANGIKVALATTKDFKTFEKTPITTFNSKATALFPEKINGKYAALVTFNTDMPPAKMGLATFDTEDDMSSPYYWVEWYDNVNQYTIHLLRDLRDQIELGSPPIKTNDGWLVIYSYISNYMSNDKTFGIEAMLLDLEDPRIILGRSESLITPEAEYELNGDVPNVIFPSGALIKDGQLFVYYGAADTRVAVASCNLEELLIELRPKSAISFNVNTNPADNKLIRFSGNPILKPALELSWQAMAVYNPAAIYEGGKVHLIYRAQAFDGTSVFGYASSKDGLHIDENLTVPVYYPREDFERKTHATGNSGCEDPRITKIDNKLYMVYTAYDGVNPPRVAMTSIPMEDFLNHHWYWDRPKLISPPGVDDKDACLVKNINGEGYFAFHRLGDVMWIDKLRDLEFPQYKFLSGGILAQARPDKWDNVKIGIAGPPLETSEGWLLLYHGVSSPGYAYKLGAMLLDYDDPRKVIARTDQPIFEPEMEYECEGIIPNVVFPCGSVIINDVLYVYYGGADTVVGVATMPLQNLLNLLLKR